MTDKGILDHRTRKSDWRPTQSGLALHVRDPYNPWHGLKVVHFTSTNTLLFQGNPLKAEEATSRLRDHLRGRVEEKESDSDDDF
jgi:hypothetical protein